MLQRLFALVGLSCLLAACGDIVSKAETAPVKALSYELPDGAWRDEFEGPALHSRWQVSPGTWAAFWERDGLTGNFRLENVVLPGNGYLVLKQTTRRLKDGRIEASGAELATAKRLGYGVYEARMRAASTSPSPTKPGAAQSGNVSAFFNYYNDSLTEIDHEIEGHRPNLSWVTSWKTRHLRVCSSDLNAVACVPARTPNNSDLTREFHTYRWDWHPDELSFYLNGVLQWRVSDPSKLPSEAAHLMFNLWPTNSELWGGSASAPADGSAQTVYMLVDYVAYRPE